MALVNYSESDDSDASSPPAKRRKASSSNTSVALPPLPNAFRDLYSSTVKASAQDDPALHEGRKRVTPHVTGQWPTHVYIEWTPSPAGYRTLRSLIAAAAHGTGEAQATIKSLLTNELGVELPLHISISRPLALKTEQKDDFLSQAKALVADAHVRAFSAAANSLFWHANESKTRWFLVLRLTRSSADELPILLDVFNQLAKSFHQPLLYQAEEPNGSSTGTSHVNDVAIQDSFHISIAWSLQPTSTTDATSGEGTINAVSKTLPMPEELRKELDGLSIEVSEVKIRVGQDVMAVPLLRSRNISTARAQEALAVGTA